MSISKLKNLAAKLQEKDEELAAFFSLSPVFLVVADDEYFLRVSSSFCEYLGYSEKELLSAPWASFLCAGSTEATDDVVEIMKFTSIKAFKNVYLAKDGTLRPLIWYASAWEADGKTYAVAIPGEESA